MPKYMVQASYTTEGTKGLLKEGGTGRRAAVEKLVSSLGGQLESMYYAFGENDVFLVLDFPDQVSMAAVAMTVKSTGTVNTKATVLLTPEEIDRAADKPTDFRPAGG
jgi:uncharacterized protein with GYD domain